MNNLLEKKSLFPDISLEVLQCEVKWIYLWGVTKNCLFIETFNIMTPYCCHPPSSNLQKKLDLIKQLLVVFISIAMATSDHCLPDCRVVVHHELLLLRFFISCSQSDHRKYPVSHLNQCSLTVMICYWQKNNHKYHPCYLSVLEEDVWLHLRHY